MAFAKGHEKKGGRVKGAENKTTKDIKEAFKNLIEMNLDNMTLWLKRVAADDPHKALKIMTDLSEYIIPKLARTETDLTSKGEQISLPTIEFKKSE